MQSKTEKFLKGVIGEEELRKEAISGTVDRLKEQDYQIVQNLGSGSFGTVFYAINEQNENMAVKIILEEKVNKNELKIWPDLKNENILPLKEVKYNPCCGTFAFFMPLISTSLDLVLEDSMFSVNKNGIELAKSYLKDVLRGVQYLHGRKLCHLDIKTSNVLICDTGKAILCDFSSLTMTDAGTDSYASPFLYRPPEAVISENNKTVVNGFLYDIYTIGFLALELFTNQAVLKSCRSIEIDSTWDMQVYPKLFEVLKKKYFEKQVKKAFLESGVDKKLINILLNFVRSCLCLNPRVRPSLNDMQDHVIFGGSSLFQRHKNDVWEQKFTSKKLSFLISLFVAQASSLKLPPDSDNCSYMEGSKSQEEQNNRCDGGVRMQISPAKIKHVPERASGANSTKTDRFMKWMVDKKSRLYSRFNHIFSKLRRSR